MEEAGIKETEEDIEEGVTVTMLVNVTTVVAVTTVVTATMVVTVTMVVTATMVVIVTVTGSMTGSGSGSGSVVITVPGTMIVIMSSHKPVTQGKTIYRDT